MQEEIILQERTWATIKTGYGAFSREDIIYGDVCLTKTNLFINKSKFLFFPMKKLFEIQLTEIKEVVVEKNKLILKTYSENYVSLKLKDVITWEFQIRQRIKKTKTPEYSLNNIKI